jgi:hypothetical protein
VNFLCTLASCNALHFLQEKNKMNLRKDELYAQRQNRDSLDKK